MTLDPRAHWERVYRTNDPTRVSWYQTEAAVSLRLVQKYVPSLTAPIIDVGGGASVLVAQLHAAGYSDLTVLDLSAAALAEARRRLGSAAEDITWIEADLLSADLLPHRYALWHDRAVFHFLTDPSDRARYIAQARSAVVPGGLVLIATFAEDGPTRCSGLDVRRYSAESLLAELGEGFALVTTEREAHVTPGGQTQAFRYCLFRQAG